MTNEEIIAVVKAHSEGKIIEYKHRNEEEWHIVEKPIWQFDVCDYRTKPESKLRPYTYAELSEALKQHGALVRRNYEYITFITFADIEHVFINKSPALRYADLMDYNWLDDDSPCGMMYYE